MDLSYSAEELAFRDEVRAWLAANLPADLRDKVTQYQHLSRDDLVRWHSCHQGLVSAALAGGVGWNRLVHHAALHQG